MIGSGGLDSKRGDGDRGEWTPVWKEGDAVHRFQRWMAMTGAGGRGSHPHSWTLGLLDGRWWHHHGRNFIFLSTIILSLLSRVKTRMGLRDFEVS